MSGVSGWTRASLLAEVAFDGRGLVPVVAQDRASGEVLMLAYANEEALRLTLTTGRAHYYSRSREALWRKGETSGHVQYVHSVAVDCDGDAVLYRVEQTGPACHTGARSCFFRSEAAAGGEALEAATRRSGSDVAGAVGATAAGESLSDSDTTATLQRDDEAVLGHALGLLERVVSDRLVRLPEGSYVARLHDRGLGYQAQKVVEEAGETVVAALEFRDDQLIAEAADLLFHLTVLLRARGQSLTAVAALLEDRHRSREEG